MLNLHSSVMTDIGWICKFTHLNTYLFTYSFIGKLIGFRLVKKFHPPHFIEPEHYRFYKCPPSAPILSQISAVHSDHPISWRSISILSSNLRPGLPLGLPTKTLHTPVLSPIHATCTAHLILLDLVTRIVFGGQYRSLHSSLCTSLHSPVKSSLLEPNILLCTLSWNTLKLRSSLKFRTPTKQQEKL